MEINTDTRAIMIDTNLFGKSREYTPGSINTETAKEHAIKLFSTIDRFEEPLYKAGYQTVFLGKFESSDIVETRNPYEAQLARVDFFRNLNEYPVLGPDPKKGMLQVVLRTPTRESSPFNYPRMDAHYWEVESGSKATYPLIPIAEAWGVVSTGGGVITNITPKDANPFTDYEPVRVETIRIDNIYLAYYETENFQKYLLFLLRVFLKF